MLFISCARRHITALCLSTYVSPNESFLRAVISGSSCGSNTGSLSTWLGQSFGKFSIYVDYEDLRVLNEGFGSVSGPPRYAAVPVSVFLCKHVVSTNVVVDLIPCSLRHWTF